MAEELTTSDRDELLRRPRLADLFLLMLNLSLFLGLCRYSFGHDYNFALWSPLEIELFGFGVGVACCWTGVMRLTLSRLPVDEWQPGEVVCIIEGAYYLGVAILGAVLRITVLGGASALADDANVPLDHRLAALLYSVPPIILCLGYVWLARRVTIPAWRRVAVAKVFSHAATPVLLFVSVLVGFAVGDVWRLQTALSVLILLCLLVPTGMILAAAWGDRRLPGVHWVHWLGVFAFAVLHLTRLSLEVRVMLD